MLCMIFGVDEPRPGNLNASVFLSPEGEFVEIPFEEIERKLLARLHDSGQNRKRVLKHLASFYADHRHYDQALERMRDLMTLETNLEDKAACILATGAIAEKREDFEAAVRFYRMALAMEPERSDVWFFIHNNLGYSLNKLGQFGEGEKFCRAAVQINPSRPNGHKNLGIALEGQGQFVEAAQSYVMATKVAPGDPRSLGLLNELLQRHPELEYEFGSELVSCEELVSFASAAIQRAQNRNIFKVLLGCNNCDLEAMFTDMFRCMTGGAVETTPVSKWDDFIAGACGGRFDLAFVIPNNLEPEDTDSAITEPWTLAVSALKRIKGNSGTAIIVSGDGNDLAEHGEECLEAGAEAAIELPFSLDALADVTRQVLTRSGDQDPN